MVRGRGGTDKKGQQRAFFIKQNKQKTGLLYIDSAYVEHGGFLLIQISLCLLSECWDYQHYHIHKKSAFKKIYVCVMCVHTGAHRGQKTGVRGG